MIIEQRMLFAVISIPKSINSLLNKKVATQGQAATCPDFPFVSMYCKTFLSTITV